MHHQTNATYPNQHKTVSPAQLNSTEQTTNSCGTCCQTLTIKGLV